MAVRSPYILTSLLKQSRGSMPESQDSMVETMDGRHCRTSCRGLKKLSPPVSIPTELTLLFWGDSNTYVFGRALKEWYVANKMISISEKQIVVKYRSGSSPRHWLPSNHPKHDRRFGHLWAKAKRFSGPAIRDTLSGNTRLVVIGLGGNMGHWEQ